MLLLHSSSSITLNVDFIYIFKIRRDRYKFQFDGGWIEMVENKEKNLVALQLVARLVLVADEAVLAL
jgi:hypothetical protein